MTTLEISAAVEGGLSVLRLTGELDVTTAPSLKDALRAPLDSASPILVSLAGVSFLDSRGIGLLVAATREARERGTDLAIVMVAASQLNSVRILKLDSFLRLVSTEDEGRGALSGAG